MDKPKSKPFALIEVFANLWSQEYGGEAYCKTGKDFRFAKEYLEVNDGDFIADVIISEARHFLRTEGIYAGRRHRFCDFIRNIGSFAPPKRQIKNDPILQCPDCGKQLPEAVYYRHVNTELCPKFKPNPQVETLINDLSKKFKI